MQKVQHDGTIPYSTVGITIIGHCVNDIKRWGRGFVVPLGTRYPESKSQYMNSSCGLGDCDLVPIYTDLYVANLYGQHTIWSQNGVPPIRYDALQSAFMNLKQEILHLQRQHPGSVINFQFPSIGAGLAGGDWKRISAMITNTYGSVPNLNLYHCVI
jgi:O-acetyl-ADP-ribose deacetylase (regulator of RNase III)